MAKAPAVVLSSGGLRSLIAAGVAAREQRIALLYLKDDRVSAKQAYSAFEKQVQFFKPIKHWVADVGYFRQMSLPIESAGIVHSTGSDPQAPLVPIRELQMISIACGFARSIKAGSVYWGCQIDQKNPDAMARQIELNQVLNQMMEIYGGDPPIAVKMPLMGLEDQQMIELGYQCNVPYQASWSCQTPGAEKPCMSCSACTRRVRAFRAAQLNDPLIPKK